MLRGLGSVEPLAKDRKVGAAERDHFMPKISRVKAGIAVDPRNAPHTGFRTLRRLRDAQKGEI